MATYNLSASLRLAIESVLQQSYSDFELWVVGDGCTDDSADVVKSFGDARLHWLNLPRNSGSQSRPNNAGLLRARGRYIAYLGHDDLWFPWHLAELVSCIEERNADFVHSLCAAVNPLGVAGCYDLPAAGMTYQQHFVPPSCWLHRREVIRDCGLWNDADRLAWPIDFDYSYRAARAGKSFASCARFTVLKFTSSFFRAYATPDRASQRAYAPLLWEAPDLLERQVLTDLSLLSRQERYCTKEQSVRHASGVFLRAILRSLRALPWPLCILEVVMHAPLAFAGYDDPTLPLDILERAGHDRWPVSGYVYRKYHQGRRRVRTMRGLPDREG